MGEKLGDRDPRDHLDFSLGKMKGPRQEDFCVRTGSPEQSPPGLLS